MKKKISILGSTGNVGKKTVELVLQRKMAYQVEALSAYSNFTLLASQAKLLNAKYVSLYDSTHFQNLKDSLLDTDIKIVMGAQGLQEIAGIPVDLSVIAILGIAGLAPVLQVINSGTKIIAIANKESIICGGKLLLQQARNQNVQIIPIDSEHNAIFQILQYDNQCIEKIILTASGGPFLNYRLEKLQTVTVDSTLKHPTWNMGKKISVDSATMMNKALEMIEAHHLFNIIANKIEVVIHPESIVHGMVVYNDGFYFAVLAEPDMAIHILYALSWPQRRTNINYRLDFTKHKKLTFQKPNYDRFHALKLSFEILNSTNIHCNSIILNAANEIAVHAFLNASIRFLDIVKIVESTIEHFHGNTNIKTLSDIMQIDCTSRIIALNIIQKQYYCA
ncbi:1-deoxy-D-xylulose-5-phosphate reductoisomerase [Wolbachia endosymbiont of Howardula sp.]|uniref:1-deoxy-D-xylulose-5-phosphate reductoisomerase n=1 Tax=Wolbachia endosymbiont of Howardula sp. TaxID=2916816 RepID=UPI00217CD7DC|nr:1-deoxy-D-xylulose-5-phosphate reductoisomerase [Wolbachia endosymbiont of Howardula sp.]UWI83077.1 1-deoxy-D-xylulose-5-phosphate reductoisomerase [Wolbachia endosymbiont of Howardula sp.]